MAKLIIGKSAPQSFPLSVSIPTPTGDAEINFDAKCLASTEWAKLREDNSERVGKAVTALFDAARKAAEDEFAADPEKVKKLTDEEKEAAISALVKPVKESEILMLRAKHSGEMISKIANGWDLDDPMTPETLAEMCDQYPGAAEAVFKAYNDAREGLKTKNSKTSGG